jgi:prevent-host-death family protein
MGRLYANQISMSRTSKGKASKPPKSRGTIRALPPGHWRLHDAEARFSELVRRARSEGPQLVTVRGRDEVVVIAAEEFRRLTSDLSGEALVAALQASPHREIDIEPTRARMPAQDVDR